MFNTICDTIRFFALRRKEPYLRMYELLGFVPRNRSLYEMALRHRSLSVRDEEGHRINNERLEFLGDAVLDMIVSELLYLRYEEREEGFLTDMRSRLVCREQLNRIALSLGMKEIVLTATKPGVQSKCVYGNALEALVGAIFLDRGFPFCKQFVLDRMIAPYIDLQEMERVEPNSKSRLIEYCQKQKLDIVFRVLRRGNLLEGEMPFFESEVVIEGVSVASGTGSSRKESEQRASKRALDMGKDLISMISCAQEEKSEEIMNLG